MRIAIDEPPPLSSTLAMTTLRSITGIVVIAHAWQSWEHPAAWQAELVRVGVVAPQLELAARWSLAAVFLLGLGLVLGWLTRLWSFGLLCAEASALVAASTHGALQLGGFEYPLLIAAVSLVFVLTGGGRISVDRFLFERARRRAIETDERWQYAPYVSVAAEQYGTSQRSLDRASSTSENSW